MNPILLVIPILSILMFDLGLTLRLSDFRLLAQRPLPVAIGLLGQLIVLPAIAYGLAVAFQLPPLFFVGLVLIACCPGGSSSNVFSMLAGGDVALSVTLTAMSSLITLVTVPLILSWAVAASGAEAVGAVHLPVGNLLMQNIVLMAVPIALGVGVKHWWPKAASAMARVLGKVAFPALMLLAGIFFVQHKETILANFGQLGSCVLALILLAIAVASLLSRMTRLSGQVRRTIVIEVGMQNAAQAIAIASSPFIFDNPVIATPAIIYALLMNIVLLTYVGVIKMRKKAATGVAA